MKNSEKHFGTNGWVSKFHKVLNTPFTDHMKYDGILLGFEKIKKNKLNSNKNKVDFNSKQKTYNLDINSHFLKREMEPQLKFSKTILNQPKSFVLTHTLKSKSRKAKVDYNIYMNNWHEKGEKLRSIPFYKRAIRQY